jgi:hypothetical protein
MKRSSFFACAVTATVLAATAACSDSSTSPGGANDSGDPQASADLAPSAGEDIAMDYQFYSAASGGATGSGSFSMNVPEGGLTPSASIGGMRRGGPGTHWFHTQCAFTQESNQFTCPTISLLGHMLDVSYQFFDTAGVAQSAYDASTTDSATLTVSDTGAFAFSWFNNGYADTSSHHRFVTLSNLAGDPDTLHIWNGTGSTFDHSVRTGHVSKTYQLTSSDTTIDLEIRLPRSANPYPISGTIIRNYDMVRTRMKSDTSADTSTVTKTVRSTRRVVVTFNGTANVPMTVGSDSYMLNLDTREVTKQ